MFESVDPVLRSDVGRGIGRSIGAKLGTLGGAALGLALASEGPVFRGAPFALGGLGNVLGRTIGGSIGKNIISDPNKPADFNKMSHRYGYLNNTEKDFFGRPVDYYDYQKRFDNLGYDGTVFQKMNPFLTSAGMPQKLKDKK